MAILSSPAIIMRCSEFGESDLLVSFFSKERGRLKGVAKSGKRSRKRFSNCLDLFCLSNLEYEQRKGDMCLLHSGILIDPFCGLRSNYEALALASYFVELTEILFPPEVVETRMFLLLELSLRRLSEGQDGLIVRTAFEACAMALGGFAMAFNCCCLCKRPFTGRGRAVVLPLKGGIACLACVKEDQLSPSISPQAVQAFESLQRPEGIASALSTLSASMAREIAPALRQHMEYRLGKKPVTARFLSE